MCLFHASIMSYTQEKIRQLFSPLELEHLRTQMKDLQTQLDILKATVTKTQKGKGVNVSFSRDI